MIILGTGKQLRVNKRIKLLQIIYSFDVEGTGGGIARFAISLSQALDPKIFDVTICGLWNTGTNTELEHIQKLNSLGVRAVTAANWDKDHPYQSLWKSYQGLKMFIQQSPVDIVHSHSEFSDIVSLMLKFSPGIPVIIRTLHNGYPLEWRRRYIRRILLTYILYPICFNSEVGVARHVVANMDRRWLTKLLGHHSKLLHNAIDVSKHSGCNYLTDKSKLGLAIPGETYVIGTVGRLREEKGYDTLLEAAALVIRQTAIPIKFLIIGDGDMAKSLQDLAKNLGISEQVIFTGPRSDIEFLLSGMDLFVCSSYWEGFSTAVLEAMAAGVPVLATDIPGNRELIEPEKTGWMVPSHDATALAEEIMNVLNMPTEERQIIVDRAKKVPLTYSIDIIAKQHEILYVNLFKEKKK